MRKYKIDFFLLCKDCCFLDVLEYSGDFSTFLVVDLQSFQCELFFIFYISLMEAGVPLVQVYSWCNFFVTSD